MAAPTNHDRATADALARLYDVDLADDPGDLDLYLALAARTGGPILELGVGTGRIAVALAAGGYAVTGVDLDDAMLRRARERATQAGRTAAANLTLVNDDARAVRPVGGPFRLVLVALNSLLVFGSRADQRRTLGAMAANLAPGGIAVADVWLPDADDLARYDARMGLEYVRRDPETGNLVTKVASAYHDAASGTVDLTSIFEEGRQGEPALRWVRHDRLRLLGSDELRSFAEDAGLEVEVLAGGYDLAPLAAGDDRAILVARNPGRARSRRTRATVAAERAAASRPGLPNAGSGLV
jgi:SAM-dependent methyltransferase